MTIASGVGSWPGSTAEEYAEAVRVVLGEVPDLPYLPELPGRGAHAGMIGRTLATITDLGLDLQPAGWRLTDASGVDHRRARSLLAQDLDQLEEQTQDFHGVLKIQVAGPWTLAAAVEKPRGDKALSDHGARRELAQALAEGVSGHLADVRRRVDSEHVVVQVDEPSLPAVLAGRVPTQSGLGTLRAVEPAVVRDSLASLVSALDAPVVVHCCAADVPARLLREAGVAAIDVEIVWDPPWSKRMLSQEARDTLIEFGVAV